MIPAVDEQLVLEVLRWMEVLARWLLSVTPTLELHYTELLEPFISYLLNLKREFYKLKQFICLQENNYCCISRTRPILIIFIVAVKGHVGQVNWFILN